jgi:subtilisin family serine protease
VVGLSAQQIATLEGRGFVVRAQFESPLVGRSVVRLAVPRSTSDRRALSQVRALDPSIVAAPNALYRRSRFTTYSAAGRPCGDRCEAFDLTAWTPASGRCTAGVSIGVIDTAVDVAHPSLAGALVTTRTTRSPDRLASDADHGTGVVSLLAGLPGSPVVGLANGARILAADAFHSEGARSAADTFDLVRSLDWLTGANVRLINMSLTGPDNDVMKTAIEATLAKGVTVVAAAGRPDGGNKLGYPARYDGVVAVAAVDTRLRPSRLSARGQHIAFAGLAVAGANGSLRQVDGTSFAAPLVTAAYAQALASVEPSRILDTLSATARDLGAPGRDDSYGWSVVPFTGLSACQ